MLGLPLDSWLLIAASTLLGPALVVLFLRARARHAATRTEERD